MDERQKAMLDRQAAQHRGAAIIDGTNGEFRQDGYSNLLNKFGTQQDSSVAYRYDQEPIADDMELMRLYEGNGLFAKIIDRPSEEAVKHGFDIDFGDEGIAEYVEDRMDELDFEAKFSTAEKWARLYGGSIIVILADDGRGLEEPLDWANVRTVEELRVFERAVVQPDYSSMYHFHFMDTIGRNRPFAEPEFYQVFSIYGYFTVHRSRCLVFRNGRLPEQTTNAIYRYWGIPEYVKIKRALRECITSHEDGVKLLERSVQAIYKMKNLANLLSTDEGENKAIQRLQLIDMARGILNSIAIDSDGEDYDFKTLAMAGVKDVIDATCNMLSAVTEIPQTILFGRSPAGMNSTGKSDMENYYNMVENIQKQNMKKNARTLIDLVLWQGKLEGKIPEVPKYKVKFAALWSMTDAEKASVDKTKADTEYVKAQTAQLYMDASVLDPSEVRNSLASEGEFQIGDVLSDDVLDLPDGTFDVGEGAALGSPIGILDQAEDGGQSIVVEMPERQLRTGGKIIIKEAETDGDDVITIKTDGGPGSGDWGHSGRPGKLGGSGGGGGKQHRIGTKEKGFTSKAKKKAEKKSSSSKSSGTGNNSEKAGASKGIDVKSVSKITRSQERNEWANIDEEDRLAYLDDAREEHANYGFTRNGTLANAIASEENMNQPPTSLSGKDFETYVKESGSKVIYRGVQNLENEEGDVLATGKDIRKEFAFASDSTYGGGNYGSGYHFADDRSYAQGFARKNEGGELLECAVKPGASFMEHSAWDALPQSVKSKYDNDEGLYALTHGYDGIISNTGITNIVNRGALVYRNPGNEDSKADGADFPAAAVLIIHDGRILCASRRNGEGLCGPGGHVEDGEDAEDAAVREAMEEFGIVPLNLQPVGEYKGSFGSYLPSMVYWTDRFSGTPEADGEEMLDARWLSIAELFKERLFPPFEESVKMLIHLLTPDGAGATLTSEADGGPGSGNFGHGGRPGKVGGSSGGGGGKPSSSGKGKSGGSGKGSGSGGKGSNSGKVSATGANKFSKGFSKRNLNEHYGGSHDHSKEYPGMTKQQYAQRALELIQKPTGGDIRGYKLPNGQIARYDKKSNDYVKGKPNEGIATMFKPVDGEAYYLRRLKAEGGTEND